METEIWKEINCSNGQYYVSNLGNIKSISFGKTGKEKLLKCSYNKKGYLQVNLFKMGKTFRVHRLVALAFIPNQNNYPQINHINGIKDDNRLENLEWCDNSHNQKEAYRLGLQKTKDNNYFKINNPNPNKGKFGKDNHLSKKVNQYDLNNNFINSYGSLREAEKETGVFNSSISACCKGKIKTTGGYIWKYNI